MADEWSDWSDDSINESMSLSQHTCPENEIQINDTGETSTTIDSCSEEPCSKITDNAVMCEAENAQSEVNEKLLKTDNTENDDNAEVEKKTGKAEKKQSEFIETLIENDNTENNDNAEEGKKTDMAENKQSEVTETLLKNDNTEDSQNAEGKKTDNAENMQSEVTETLLKNDNTENGDKVETVKKKGYAEIDNTENGDNAEIEEKKGDAEHKQHEVAETLLKYDHTENNDNAEVGKKTDNAENKQSEVIETLLNNDNTERDDNLETGKETGDAENEQSKGTETLLKNDNIEISDNAEIVKETGDDENKQTEGTETLLINNNTENSDSAEIEKKIDNAENEQSEITEKLLKYDKTVNVENAEIEETRESAENVQQIKKHRVKKRKTRQKLKYVSSSSDDDVPLSVYAKIARNTPFGNSDSDLSYDPGKEEDINSTDSEYTELISEETHDKIKEKHSLKRQWEKTVKQIEKKRQKRLKEKSSPRKTKKKTQVERNTILQKRTAEILEESASVAYINETIIERETKKIDYLLSSNNLIRDKVQSFGNCFFEASGKQLGIDASFLRSELCKTLEDNMEDYVEFLLNRHHPDDEEKFVSEYLTEVEKLKGDGYWTSSVADLLPLVLANYATCNVIIYTNKDEQPVITIKPSTRNSEGAVDENNSINLVYTSIPGICEHYDACVLNMQQREFTATPLREVENTQQGPQNNELLTPEKKKSSTKTTPRKRAIFITPEKKFLVRKRKATPENWKKNMRKKLRLSGEEYRTADGKTKPARSIKPVNCSKCRLKCETKITCEQRQQLFDSFWSLGNYERQKDYVCARIEETGTRTYLDEKGKTKSKRKKVARKFSFEIENEKHSVCKTYFMNTLSIGKAYIDHAMKSKKDGHFAGKDLRGKHVPHNKLPKSKIDQVKKHIESFPKVSAHYVRKETNRQFLGPELTVRKMYDLYADDCKTNEIDPVSLEKYRDIFNKNYNFSFHVPKKDQCNTCNAYYKSVEEDSLTAEQKEAYENHQKRKTGARQEKETDKNSVGSQPNIHVACFDLQSVLYTPCSLVSLMYYMHKLCCYNLTFYSLGDNKGTCFVWSETDAKRGSSEVAMCLKKYIQSLAAEVDHVILYSDACGGQNRNKIIATCLLHCVTTIPNIK